VLTKRTSAPVAPTAAQRTPIMTSPPSYGINQGRCGQEIASGLLTALATGAQLRPAAAQFMQAMNASMECDKHRCSRGPSRQGRPPSLLSNQNGHRTPRALVWRASSLSPRLRSHSRSRNRRKASFTMSSCFTAVRWRDSALLFLHPPSMVVI
jgi:hypothetical protein